MIKTSEIIQTIKRIVELRFKVLREEVEDQFSTLLTRVIVLVLMALATLMILLFASLSLAFYLGEMLYSPYLGFMYVTLLYVALFIMLYFARESVGLQNSIKNGFRRFVFRIKAKKEEE